MDIAGIDLALWIVAPSHCDFAFINPNVIHCSFMLFDLLVSENKLSLICLTFRGTLNQPHFTLLFMFPSFHISVSSCNCFYGARLLASASAWQRVGVA
jgi:hypothetical protein